MSNRPPAGATHPMSMMFLLHIAIEAPLAVQGLFMGEKLPFIEMTNTTLVLLKMYAALSLASCLMAVLVYSLPEFLPGKRAIALGLLIYHCVISAVLLNAPRFIPMSLGPFFEQLTVTPERIWGAAHAAIGFGFASWWQVTLRYADMMKKAQ